MGWTFFLAVTTDIFNGPAGNTYLPASDWANAAYTRMIPPPPAPVVDGVRLDDEPDKMTGSDQAIKAYEDHQKVLNEHRMCAGRAGTIGDLLASILAAPIGALIGRLLAPGRLARSESDSETELPPLPDSEAPCDSSRNPGSMPLPVESLPFTRALEPS